MTAGLLLALKVLVAALIFAIGLGSTPGDLAYLWRRPGLLLRSVVAMYVAVPLAILALVLLDLIYLRIWLPGFWRFADRYLELPLTVVLLWAMGELDWIGPLERALSWLGQHSYGLYLGQILTHNAFIYVFGGSCTLYGCEDGLFEEFNLWIYIIDFKK